MITGSTQYDPGTKSLATVSTQGSCHHFGNAIIPSARKTYQHSRRPIKCYWQRAKCPSKLKLTTGPKDICKLVQWDKICMEEGVLYHCIRPPKTGTELFQLHLPESLKAEVRKRLHDERGHQGVECTIHLVRERCFWSNMWKDIEKYCQTCKPCLVAKVNQPKLRTFPGNIMASQPLEILAIDFIVLDKADDGRENVITDVFFKNSLHIQPPTRDLAPHF